MKVCIKNPNPAASSIDYLNTKSAEYAAFVKGLQKDLDESKLFVEAFLILEADPNTGYINEWKDWRSMGDTAYLADRTSKGQDGVAAIAAMNIIIANADARKEFGIFGLCGWKAYAAIGGGGLLLVLGAWYLFFRKKGKK